jgi:hypothetical protein
MYVNSGYLNNSRVPFREKKKALRILSAGTYQLHSWKRLPTWRPKGRVDWQLVYVCAGEGHFIHTYMGDGNPLPSYEGEPTPVTIDTDDLDEFTKTVWEALNDDNKVSLFTRFIDVETGKYETRIVNKNQKNEQ